MLDGLSNMNSIFVYGLLFFFAFILSLFLLSLRPVPKNDQKPNPANPVIGRNRLGFFSILLLFMAATILLLYASLLRAFTAFTKEEPVAYIVCDFPENDNYDFRLNVMPLNVTGVSDTLTFDMRGDQWAIGGDILQWDSAVNFLGLHTMYRLVRLEGRYEDVEDQKQLTPSVYSLTDKEKHVIWNFLYKYGKKLPLVKSSYGNSVYTFPSFEDVAVIKVTTSGYKIEFKN